MAARRPSDRAGRSRGLATAGRVAGGRARAAAGGSATLGRHTAAVAAASAALARAAGRWALAAARSDTGRRLARAVALTVTLAMLIGALYDRAEAPRAAAQPPVAAPAGAPGGPPTRARAGGARRPDPAGQGGLRGRPRPPRAGERPAAVAAAWYAARQGLPAARVEALQQDRLSASEVRVLVLADHGRGRLRTALVRVRLGAAGWSVR
jgi:hypothetical protein